MWNSLWKTGKKNKRLRLFLPPWPPVTLREHIQGQLLFATIPLQKELGIAKCSVTSSLVTLHFTDFHSPLN